MPFLAAMALDYLLSSPSAAEGKAEAEMQTAQETSIEHEPAPLAEEAPAPDREQEPRLPPELLLELAPHLSARDLLALALASRSCHALLQAHLKWYTTKLPGSLPKNEQAPLVRRVVYEAPPSVEGDTSELRSFIGRATRLESLTWRGSGLPDSLWQLIWRDCPHLHDVEVVDVSGEVHGSVCKIFDAPYLTRLIYYTTSLPSTAITALPPSALDQSLARQQGLTELRLGSFSPSGGGGAVAYAGWLLSEATWPHLRILELAHHHAGDEEAVARFMDRHPGLEILSLPSVEDASGRAVYLDNIADDALPELRHFVGSAEAAVHILRGKRDKLRSIGGIGFDAMLFGLGIPQNWVATPQGRCILEGLSQASGLIELEGSFTLGVRPTDVRVLFANAPKLQRVKLDCRPSGSLDAWLPIFALIPSLTSLSFPLHMLSMPSRGPQNGSMTLRSSPSPPFIESLRQRVLKLSTILPNLETVEFDGSGTTPVARVKRYAGTTEVEEVTLLRGEQPWIRSADANVWRSRVCVALS